MNLAVVSSSTDEISTNDIAFVGICRHLQVEDWYAVDYDGTLYYDGILYPGEVVSIGAQDDNKVSVMEPAGQNWKWLTPRDAIYHLIKYCAQDRNKCYLITGARLQVYYNV